MTLLASIASSLAKFAGDLRILQSPAIGEWSEPFGKKQVGSSAMPYKKNPVNSEKICSLARYITQLPAVALENATHSYLERTLDDSANKRIIMAEAFIALDEILKTGQKIIDGLVVNEKKIANNVSQFAPFAATESIIISLVKKGANRQEMHELLREISMIAWSAVQNGEVNPMVELLQNNKVIQKYLSSGEITKLLDITHHTGDAAERAKRLTKKINKTIVL
jgi:adenylosuccinate lyase